MLDLPRQFGSSIFDGVSCFGNTLVHLLNHRQIGDFFSGVKTVLKPSGCFLMQILHYDYIFQEKVEKLPVIENESVKFERNYIFIPESREIRFITRLTIKVTDEVIENETFLLGIGVNDIKELMNLTGFTGIQLYSDFQKTPFGGKYLPLVIACQNNG
jgi:glycine/sarcosine N-methyltransferase